MGLYILGNTCERMCYNLLKLSSDLYIFYILYYLQHDMDMVLIWKTILFFKLCLSNCNTV